LVDIIGEIRGAFFEQRRAIKGKHSVKFGEGRLPLIADKSIDGG